MTGDDLLAWLLFAAGVVIAGWMIRVHDMDRRGDS